MRWSSICKVFNHPTGYGQGYFRYFKPDGTYEEILAISGKLYREDGSELSITGLTSFQGTRQIEAVQFKDKMYFATGTKLVEYDGTEAKVIVPYTPQPLEALYIGTNALADNPDAFITDGTATFLRIDGVVPNKRYGVSNADTVFTIFVSKPTGTVEYKMEYSMFGQDTWKVAQDWETNKTPTFKFTNLGEYELRFTARMQGTTDEVVYFIPKYTVHSDNKANEVNDTSTIQQCNRILVHWERLVMYGDLNQPDMMYVSDVGRPDYFPTLGTLRFENERREGLTAMVEYRDMLVAFTPNSVQALFGRSPADYSRVMLSSALGCIAPYSAKVMENHVTFLSQEGVHVLKSLGYTEQRANVQKLDEKIDNIVPRETNACAIVADGQYQLVYPTQKKRFRFYYQQGVWTKDESEKLDFVRMYEWNGLVLGQRSNGNVLYHDDSVFDDDGYVYADKVVFKDYSFNAPYNIKKLKELQMLVGYEGNQVDLSVSLYTDDSAILDPDSSYATLNEAGEAIWVEKGEPNLTIPATSVLGQWVLGDSPLGGMKSQVRAFPISGKCHRVRLEILHNKPVKNSILGFGFIFKMKKPKGVKSYG